MGGQTTFLGVWRCPWSGSEFDPMPKSYALWVRLYWAEERVRHAFGAHSRYRIGIVDSRCTWCGENAR